MIEPTRDGSQKPGVLGYAHVESPSHGFSFSCLGSLSRIRGACAGYNFSWQIPYRWEPGKKRLPKGTRLECIAHYDNSAFNPYNPDPLATVRHGPQTHHEMMYGFFFFTEAEERLGLRVDEKTGRVRK